MIGRCRYDRKEATALRIEDVQIWATMGPPGGSRQEISPRCLRHFHVVAVNPFSDVSMTHIFSTILTIHLTVIPPFPQPQLSFDLNRIEFQHTETLLRISSNGAFI